MGLYNSESSFRTVGPSSILRPHKNRTPITEINLSSVDENNHPRGQTYSAFYMQTLVLSLFPIFIVSKHEKSF